MAKKHGSDVKMLALALSDMLHDRGAFVSDKIQMEGTAATFEVAKPTAFPRALVQVRVSSRGVTVQPHTREQSDIRWAAHVRKVIAEF